MAQGSGAVRLLGPWSFTLQNDTPPHWLKCGPLDSYLMKMHVEVSATPGTTVTCGIMFHSGTQSVLGGGNVWMEIKDGRKVYRSS